MGYIDALSSGNYVIYNRSIARNLGVEAAILLGYFCNQASLCGNEFYYQIDRIADDTAMGKFAIQAAIKKLAQAGIVTVEKKGLPAKNIYTIHEKALAQSVVWKPDDKSSDSPVTCKSDDKKSNNIYSSIQDSSGTKKAKRTYGEFANVRLTDDELKKLRERFCDADARIESASVYLKAKGDKYKSHYAMLLNWARMEVGRKQVAPARRYDHEY